MGLRWLAIGDSITKGTGSSLQTNAYAYKTRAMLQQNGQPVSLINTGISGIRSDEALLKYKGFGGRCDPDLVTIFVGTNDNTQAVSTSTFQTNLQNLINDVKQHKSSGQCQIVLLNLIYRTDAYYSNNPAFNSVISTIAQSNNIPLCDISNAITSSANMSDNVHPNDAGHLAIANILYPLISGLNVWKNVPQR